MTLETMSQTTSIEAKTHDLEASAEVRVLALANLPVPNSQSF